jgi:hypothetical protein
MTWIVGAILAVLQTGSLLAVVVATLSSSS